MENNLLLHKEIDVKEAIFNLKSASTGKYSVQDSYKDNYENGLLAAINAPADPNQALKDIYYANEKGTVISYKDFNDRVVSLRSSIIAKNFPDRQLKDLLREERVKIEKDIAKQVLKSLAINETTKLIYSPELTSLRNEYAKDSKNINIRYDKENLKLLVSEQAAGEEAEKIQDDIIILILEFSEEIKTLSDKALNSDNLDELELSLIDIDAKFNKLSEAVKGNSEIKDVYKKQRQKLKEGIEALKERQQKYENEINEKINKVLADKDFKNLKKYIKEIEENYKNNPYLSKDTKSNSIKEAAIGRLKNIGKTIALAALKKWDYKNLKTASGLFEQALPSEFELILKKKFTQESNRLKIIENKLFESDLNDSRQVYNKLNELTGNKELFIKFYSHITSDGFETINRVLEDLRLEFTGLIILFARNLDKEKFIELWQNLSDELTSRLLNARFEQGLRIAVIRDLYFELLFKKGSDEKVIQFFSSINKKYLKALPPAYLSEIISTLYKYSFDMDAFIKKISPYDLLEVIKSDKLTNNRLREMIIFILCKWLPFFGVKSPVFKQMITLFPEFVVYNLNNQKITEISEEDKLLLVENLEKKEAKDALQYFFRKGGKDNFNEIVKLKLKNILSENPSDFDSQFNYALSCLETGDYTQAAQAFNRCVSINPQSAEAHYYIGFIAEKNGDNLKAMNEYKEAIRLKYNLAEAHYNLAMIYYKQGTHPLAIQELKKLIKINADFYEAHFSLGIIYDEIQDYNSAIEEYKKAIAIAPEKAVSYINLASDLSLLGKFEEAIQYYQTAVRYDDKNPGIQYNLGILYQREKNFPMAIAHYKLAIKFDPSNSDAYNNLGLIYFARKELDKAIEMWQKAITINNNIDAYNNLGWSYFVLGDINKALETYQKAKEINPNHAILYLNLGTIYYKAGETENALKSLQDYMDIETDRDKTYEVMKIVMSLKKIS